MGNKETVFERRLYSIRYDGTGLKLITPEKGSHFVRITGSKNYFIDTFSNMEQPRRIILKELRTGKALRVLGETDIEQFVEYEWSSPQIVHFPSLDSTTTLDGMLILPPNYNSGKKYPVIIHGYGMPGTQIVWNRWGSTWDQYLAPVSYTHLTLPTILLV